MERFAKATARIIKKLPYWWKIKKDPTNSQGAYFLDVIGMELDDAEYILNFALRQRHLINADISQADICYKSILPSGVDTKTLLTLATISGIYPEKTTTLTQFFAGFDQDQLYRPELVLQHPYYIDYERKIIYVRNPYDITEDYPEGQIKLIVHDKHGEIVINHTLMLYLHHVWNFFDEFGLILDCPRIYGEKNKSYKDRLLSVLKFPGGAHKEGTINNIARHLYLNFKAAWRDASQDLVLDKPHIAPHSIMVNEEHYSCSFDDLGRIVLTGDPDQVEVRKQVTYAAQIELKTLWDKTDHQFMAELFTPDGEATERLRHYIDYIKSQVPIEWGQFKWGQSAWDPQSPEVSGKAYIPSFCDALTQNLEAINAFKSGAGDGMDLFVKGVLDGTIIKKPIVSNNFLDINRASSIINWVGSSQIGQHVCNLAYSDFELCIKVIEKDTTTKTIISQVNKRVLKIPKPNWPVAQSLDCLTVNDDCSVDLFLPDLVSVNSLETIITPNDHNIIVKRTEVNQTPEGLAIKVFLGNSIFGQGRWSPLIKSGYYYINDQEYYLFANNTPKTKQIEIDSYSKQRVAYQILFSATGLGGVVNYQINQNCIIPFDGQYHLASTLSIRDIVSEYLRINDLDLNLLNNVITYSVTVPETFAVQFNPNGLEPVSLASVDTVVVQNMVDNVFVFDQNNEITSYPPPQQNAPVIIYDDREEPLRQIFFIDDQGQLTLINTEILLGVESNTLELAYDGIDFASLSVEFDTTGYDNWQGTQEFDINGNRLVFPFILTEKRVRVRYSLLGSFYVDYNYQPDLLMTKIKLYDPDSVSGRVRVIYETDNYSSYYIAEEVNLNPVMSVDEGRFIFISDEIPEAKDIKIFSSSDMIINNGHDQVNLFILILDRYKNPIPYTDIKLSTDVGVLYQTALKTNISGMAYTTYVTADQLAEDLVNITITAGDIEVVKTIRILNENTTSRLVLNANMVGDNIKIDIYAAGVDFIPLTGIIQVVCNALPIEVHLLDGIGTITIAWDYSWDDVVIIKVGIWNLSAMAAVRKGI